MPNDYVPHGFFTKLIDKELKLPGIWFVHQADLYKALDDFDERIRICIKNGLGPEHKTIIVQMKHKDYSPNKVREQLIELIFKETEVD